MGLCCPLVLGLPVADVATVPVATCKAPVRHLLSPLFQAILGDENCLDDSLTFERTDLHMMRNAEFLETATGVPSLGPMGEGCKKIWG